MYNDINSVIDALKNLTSTGEALKSDLLSIINNTSVSANGDLTIVYGSHVDGVGTAQIIVYPSKTPYRHEKTI